MNARLFACRDARTGPCLGYVVASLFTLMFLASTLMAQQGEQPAMESADQIRQRYEKLLALPWTEGFSDPCTGDWKDKWFLDGELAKVENTSEGMVFAAGPRPGQDASHAVLWTRDSFEGNIKIEWDFTRLDTANRNVNIVYIQATGKQEGPYTKDIASWAELRRVPAMRSYFNNMNLFHISYAVNTPDNDYVRLRRYPTAPDRPFNQLDIPPDYLKTGLFRTNETYHFTVIKMDDEIFFEVKNADARRLFHWSTKSVDPITEGRVGIRHMGTRVSRYKDVSVATLK